MIKQNKTIIFGVMALIFLVASITFLIQNKTVHSKKLDDVEIYFLNPGKNLIEPEKHSIVSNSQKQILIDVLKILESGPQKKNLSKLTNDNIFLNSIQVKNDKTLEADFSSDYKKLSFAEEIMFRGAFVWTVTSLDFVDNVRFYIDGIELLKSDGKPVGLMNRQNTIINPKISPENTDARLIKLYFRDKENLSLVPEERIINIDSSQPLEKYIIEQLISGPANSNLISTISSDTKLRDIKTDENVCYVNFSSEFLPKDDNTSKFRYTLYSIVNSLTELDYIKKVQFLVDSKKIEQFKTDFDLNKTFERDESLIKQMNAEEK